MALDQLPALTQNPNQGFNPTDPSPISSLKWRHLSTAYQFTDVQDVLDYHNNVLHIDLQSQPLSLLDLEFETSANLTSVTLSMRFIRDSDGQLVETPLTVGEKGNSLGIANHPSDPTKRVIRGISVTNQDQFDGTPIYDFNNMGEEGVYEIVVRMEDSTGNILYLRIPFQFDNFHQQPTNPGGGTPGGSGGGVIKADEYYVTITEGVTPFTKRPATHYRMAAIGVMYDPYCFKRIETPPTPYVANPAPAPIAPGAPPVPCAFKVTPETATGSVGSTVKFNFTHVNTSGVIGITAQFDSNALNQLADDEFEILIDGTHDIKFVAQYSDGQECEFEVQVVGVFQCHLTASQDGSKEVGEAITVTLSHGSNSALNPLVSVIVPQGITQTGDYTFETTTGEGAYEVQFNVTYDGGYTCTTKVVLEFTQPMAQCGELTTGGSGQDVRNMEITTAGTVYIHFDLKGAKDSIYLYGLNGTPIWQLLDEVYNHYISFNFDPAIHGNGITIAMNEQGGGSGWGYTVYCPCDPNIPPTVKNNATHVGGGSPIPCGD